MKSQMKNKKILLILAVSLVIAVAGSASAVQVTLNPDGASYINDLDPTPSFWANWQTVVTDDGDTSFVGTGSEHWLTDLYSLEDPGVSGTINWVRIYVKARSGNIPGQTGLQTAIGTDSLTYYGIETTLSTIYTEYYTEYGTNPKTLTAWTWAEINDLQGGVQLRRSIIPPYPPGTKPWSRCTLVWVVVDYTPTPGFEPDYYTYTQGGWGSTPHGGNPGQILHYNFVEVYPTGVEVGIPGESGYSMTFTTAQSVTDYLPATKTPGALTSDLTNPTSSSSGVFGGQVLALQLNVDFSAAGITEGLGGPVGDLKLCNTSTSLDGQTIAQILGVANTALGGGALPTDYSISQLNDLVDNLNKAFDGGVASAWAVLHLCK